MQEVNRDIFYGLIADFAWIPFTQTLAYNLSIVSENTLHFYVDDPAQPQVGCVGFERRKAGLRMLCVSGECLREEKITDRKKYAEFYRAIRELDFDIFELNFNTAYSADAEIALRTGGWLRPVGLFSTALSKVIPTKEPLRLDRSWKHNLKKAHENGLCFKVADPMDESHIQDYVRFHREMLQRKGFNEGLTESNLSALSKDPHFKMGLVTDSNGLLLAGHIFYVHPLAASSLYAFTSPEGRNAGAANFLYESMLSYLAQNDISTFDVGRISPSTHQKNNIFLFKDGMGGEYVTYLGEWEYCRKSWMSILLYFAKKHIWKRVRV